MGVVIVSVVIVAGAGGSCLVFVVFVVLGNVGVDIRLDIDFEAVIGSGIVITVNFGVDDGVALLKPTENDANPAPI